MQLIIAWALLLASCEPLYPRLPAKVASAPAPSDQGDASTAQAGLNNFAPNQPSISFTEVQLVGALVAPLTCLSLTVEFDPGATTLAAEPVALATSSQTGRFYADAACQQGLSSAPFAPDADGTAVFYEDSAQTGQITLTANDAGTLGLVANSLSFTADLPVTLQFYNASGTTPPWTIPASSCVPINVILVDQAGNPVQTGDNINVSLSMPAASGGVFSNATCTQPISATAIPAGPDPTSSFFIQGLSSGNATLTATPTSSPALKAATGQITFTTR